MLHFYKILEVSPYCSLGDIKKSYHKLALKYHPDRNPSEEAKTKILEINEAYEVLGDKEHRQNYDNELNGVKSNPFPNMNANFNDINGVFNMMFNGMPMHRGMPNIQIFRNGSSTTHVFTSNTTMSKPPQIVKPIEITLDQAYTGCTVPIEIERWVEENNNKRIEKSDFMIEISSGIRHNETIVINNIGNQNQHMKGDLKIIITINNTTQFKQHGLDLIYDKPISLKEALCGFSFEFQHVNGKKLAMNNNNPITIITPGYKQVIQGLGMKRDNSVGNLIFNFHIEFPSNLSEQQRTDISNVLP